MPTFKDDTMKILETTIDKYGTTGDTCTESAIRDLLTDLRHYYDQHEIGFEDCLEGALMYISKSRKAPRTMAPNLTTVTCKRFRFSDAVEI